MDSLVTKRQYQLMKLKTELTSELQDRVYDTLNEKKKYMYKGQKFCLYKVFDFKENGASFHFVVDIEAEQKSSFTYNGTISAQVTLRNGWRKSDTITLYQGEITQQGIFSRIWSWIKSFF